MLLCLFFLPQKTNLTPLIIAASAGKTQIVRLLLGKGADINSKNEGGHSALQYAASKNHSEVLVILKALGSTWFHDTFNCYLIVYKIDRGYPAHESCGSQYRGQHVLYSSPSCLFHGKHQDCSITPHQGWTNWFEFKGFQWKHTLVSPCGNLQLFL